MTHNIKGRCTSDFERPFTITGIHFGFSVPSDFISPCMISSLRSTKKSHVSEPSKVVSTYRYNKVTTRYFGRVSRKGRKF